MGAEAKGNNLIKDDPKIYACLIDGFTKGYTDAEACLSADIGLSTLHRYIELNPAFQDRKENLKLNPILTAKSRVVSELDKDTKVGVTTAKWYLERKTQEFKPPQKDTNINFNTLNLLTESQIKDRLAHKLTKVLTLPDPDVTEAEVVTDDMSNTEEDG